MNQLQLTSRQLHIKPSHLMKHIMRSWQLYALLMPAVIYFLLFHYWPMYGVQIAFLNYTPGVDILQAPWVGLYHFSRFVSSPQFSILVGNTLAISIYSLIAGFPMPILLALTLNEIRSDRFKRTAQTITYAPYFISTVVMASMIISFLSPGSGIVNKFLNLFGVADIDFMIKPGYFRSIYVLSGIWQTAGWGSIIYLAALSSIDPALHEAAKIDGASRLQRIWHINLPGIAPTIVILLILNAGGIMNVGFEKTFLLQNSLNLENSEVISTYVYKVGLLGSKFSYTSAIGLFNSLINFILLLLVNSFARRFGETSLW